MDNTTTAETPAISSKGTAATLTAQKVTVTSAMTKQQRTTTFQTVTTKEETSTPTHLATSSFVTSENGTFVTTHQGQSALTTTELSSTVDYSVHVQHHSLVETVGNKLVLLCSCSFAVKERFRWRYSSVGSQRTQVIYNGFKIKPGMAISSRVTVSKCNDRNCTFTVDSVQLGDAGLLVCATKMTVLTYWSLIVLGKYQTYAVSRQPILFCI